MKKNELIIRISKVLGLGNTSYRFSSNKTTTVVSLYFKGESIFFEENDLESFGKAISNRIFILVSYTEGTAKKYIPYKCIFSDKLLCTSAVISPVVNSVSGQMERIHEMILPMSQEEAVFIFQNLP